MAGFIFSLLMIKSAIELRMRLALRKCIAIVNSHSDVLGKGSRICGFMHIPTKKARVSVNKGDMKSLTGGSFLFQ